MFGEIVIDLKKEINGELKFDFEKAESLFDKKGIRSYSTKQENNKLIIWTHSIFKYYKGHPFAYIDRIELSAQLSNKNSSLIINYKYIP